jgi:tetratricopeptide (TPR) repeat protein
VGSLHQTPLPLLLVGLHRDGFTGRLTLSSDAVTRQFEWRAGLPVSIASRLPAESLAEILVRAGALDAAQKGRVAQIVAERGASELQAIAGLGAVAPKALLLALAEQLRRALLASLGWRSGSFSFEPREAVGAAPALPLDFMAVLFEGTAAAWRPHEVLGALGERATRFPTLAPGASPRWLPVDSPARALLARLDGRSAAFALLQQHPEPECAAALWLLDGLGALAYAEQPAAAAAEPEAPPEPAGPRIEIVVRGRPASGEAESSAASQRKAAAAGKGADEDLRREIQDLHARLRTLPLWELLGVARDASAKDVRRAYLNAAKRLHPDRLAQLGLLDLKEAANEVFAEIARAHEVLSDPEQRERYEATLGETPAAAADADRIAEAEASYVRGDRLLRAGNFRGALEFLERAVALWPEEAEYQAALGWALHRKTPAESERAREHFEKAFSLGTQQAVWWLRGSLVARSLGDEKRAAELAARARSIDPNVKA